MLIVLFGFATVMLFLDANYVLSKIELKLREYIIAESNTRHLILKYRNHY